MIFDEDRQAMLARWMHSKASELARVHPDDTNLDDLAEQFEAVAHCLRGESSISLEEVLGE